MNKLKTLFSAMLVCTFCTAAAFAQGAGKPKIAVYATGGKSAEENTAIGTKILAALVEDGKYLPVERTAAFLNEIAKEHGAQRSGAVDESEISRLGKQFGVQFVCIADITELLGSNLVSTRIIDVETAEVVAMGTANSNLRTLTDLTNVSNEVTDIMFASSGGRGTNKIAVYATGAKTAGENRALGTVILSELVRRGTYRAVERSNAFLAEIDKEQLAQRGGAVDESQISRLGKQFGVQFVCIADIAPAFGSNLISARIIDVESAEVVAMGRGASPLQSLSDLTGTSRHVANTMLITPAGSRGTSKVAVYVTGLKNESESRAFGTEILAGLVKDGMYRAVERSNAFVAEIAKEQAKQRSGAIDDNQISELGKQFGVQFVCIANVTEVYGSRLVSARIVDVETAVVVAIGETESKLGSLADLSDAADKIRGVLQRQTRAQTKSAPAETPPAVTTAPAPRTAENVMDDGRKQLAAEPKPELDAKPPVKPTLWAGIGLDVLGAGLIFYGLIENVNVARSYNSKAEYDKAKSSEKSRNIAYTIGAAALIGGVTIHILF
ncbi:MAG: hypothetical protein FWB94_11235 [Chitinispirillia bacterium]|nr:hypothetical protein [Chitinispirillia bacterium]